MITTTQQVGLTLCSSFGLKQKDIKILKHICKENNQHMLSSHDALLFEICLPQPTQDSNQTHALLGKSTKTAGFQFSNMAKS